MAAFKAGDVLELRTYFHARLMLAGNTVTNRPAANAPPTRRVRGAANVAATASSATPDTWVYVRAEPGRAVGTCASKNWGVTKWSTPAPASNPARRSAAA